VREGTGFAVRETYDKALVDAIASVVANKAASTDARVAALNALAPLHRQRPAWDGKWWVTQPRVGVPQKPKAIEWDGTPVVLTTIDGSLQDSDANIRKAAIAALQVAPDPKTGDTLAA